MMRAMFVLAQLSDLHMSCPPQLSELLGKRGLGFINWQRKRKYIHRPEALDAVVRDLKALSPDHIAVTGDLVNLSLPAEYARSQTWLKALGCARDVTLVPGNHDVYVRGVEAMPARYWGDYMRSDDGVARFPFVRRRGGVALIALSTGVPTGPFMATGRLGASQLSGFAEALQQTRDAFRVVLIHHPPVSPLRRYLRRLTDAADFRRVVAEHGANLILHGHDHRRAVVWLDGPGATKIPSVGVPSASALVAHGGENVAGYNLYRIDPGGVRPSCELVGRERAADGKLHDVVRQPLQ